MPRLPVLPGDIFSGNGLECELSQAIVYQGPAYTWYLAPGCEIQGTEA